VPPVPRRATTDDLDALMEALPAEIVDQLRSFADRSDLLEVVMDLGRRPEARFAHGEEVLLEREIGEADIAHVVDHIGAFGGDNRAGIERTLHRISAIRNRGGKVVGLTCRIGRAVFGTIDIIRDHVESGQSILLLGRPGVGKTTMLREVARVLADDLGKRVVVVDTSNEIAGDGDIPHPGIGDARRMQVRTPTEQHAVMIEAVENHMPEVIVIDEIGTELEAAAARTIAERGVQLIATAHGQTLENLLVNPTLNDLLGGIQSVTLSDEEARRRGTQKSVLERKAPPTFDVLVEIQDRDRVAIHMPLADTVDAALRGPLPTPKIRVRTREGRVISNVETPLVVQPEAVPATGPVQKPLGIFPFGVSRHHVEQTIRELDLPVRVLGNLDGAGAVLTLKNHYRRRPDSLRQAESRGLPIHILKSNTVTQVRDALARIYGVDKQDQATTRALAEAAAAIRQVKTTLRPVEISPQNAYLRRLQHQLVAENDLSARSMGKEPQRRLRITPTPEQPSP
jgi:stage III sporulation protein SpoIIIAA